MTPTLTATAPSKPNVDIWLFGATLALVAIGLLMVCDASFPKSLDSVKLGNDPFYYGKQQALGVGIGLAALLAMMQIGYWRLRQFALPLMLLGLALLAAVWIPHLGVRINGAARWVHLGMTFQPSEFAKMALILYLSARFSRPGCKIGHLVDGLSGPLCIIGVYLLLIEREPDLGTACVLLLVAVTLLFLAGARKRHIALICAGALLAVFLAGFVFKHRTDRLEVFLHPAEQKEGIGYQMYQSRLAVGSGRWFGVGWGQGRGKYYLPEANTDFIFATMSEELGFVGVLPVILLFGLIGWRGFVIARQTKDRFGQLLAGGITALISWQALINVAVVTGSIPATGVPLPFISLGSTSLIFLMIGVGLLLNIAQNPMPPVETMAQ
ncbi:MAG TPA: putative peptidoglycan glycosyltransferase FtsW [Chthonomonadaceae bacterium]|nr:putative peptidoglycan glycosyltransferase FtsW [Chthonomonadaceae bacterium]